MFWRQRGIRTPAIATDSTVTTFLHISFRQFIRTLGPIQTPKPGTKHIGTLTRTHTYAHMRVYTIPAITVAGINITQCICNLVCYYDVYTFLITCLILHGWIKLFANIVHEHKKQIQWSTFTVVVGTNFYLCLGINRNIHHVNSLNFFFQKWPYKPTISPWSVCFRHMFHRIKHNASTCSITDLWSECH